MATNSDTPMTLGDARRWARRFRKLGFSPVTLHYDDTGTDWLPVGHYYIQVQWRHETLPDDQDDYAYYLPGFPCVYRTNRSAASRHGTYRAMITVLGSKPMPRLDFPRQELRLIAVERIRMEYDYWPLDEDNTALPQ